MSELKVILATPHPKMKNACDGAIEVYLKSEADKVIAEKDKEIVELKGQVNGFKNRSNLWKYNAVEEHKKFVQADLRIIELKRVCKDKDDWCLHTLKENCHHKYKRCLAMAEMCKARYDKEDARVNGRGASWDYTSDEMKYWERWHRRWLELANQFNPNSTATKENSDG